MSNWGKWINLTKMRCLWWFYDVSTVALDNLRFWDHSCSQLLVWWGDDPFLIHITQWMETDLQTRICFEFSWMCLHVGWKPSYSKLNSNVQTSKKIYTLSKLWNLGTQDPYQQQQMTLVLWHFIFCLMPTCFNPPYQLDKWILCLRQGNAICSRDRIIEDEWEVCVSTSVILLCQVVKSYSIKVKQTCSASLKCSLAGSIK